MSSTHKNLSDFSHLQVGSAAGLQFTIVVSQWNAEITGALLNGALETLGQHGAEALSSAREAPDKATAGR